MSLFKNKIGRPSNETKSKRRMIIIIVAVIVLCAVGGISFYLMQIFGVENVDVVEKNSVADLLYVGKQYYADLSYVNRNNTVFFTACPSGFKLTASLGCSKIDKRLTRSVRYTGSDYNAKANQLCKTYGFTYATSLSYYKALKTLKFTCVKNIETPISGYYAKYYNQIDDINKSTISGCSTAKTLRNSGSMVTSTAMVFYSLGKYYSPENLNNYAKTHTKQSCSNGSYYMGFITNVSKYYGLNVSLINNSNTLDKNLKTGKCAAVVALKPKCSAKYCTDNGLGHTVAVFASDKSGKVYVSDPLKRENNLVLESASNLLKNAQNTVALICNEKI